MNSGAGRAAGFTLIEILIALSVLVVGLVGIFALFPVGMAASRGAVEDTSASILAESIQSSIVISVNQSKPGEPIDYWHDGVPTGERFTLPVAGGPGASVQVPARDVFRVAQLPARTLPNSFGVVDEEDRSHYAQYAFNFSVRPSSSPAIDTLYEFIIRVFRNYEVGTAREEPVLVFIFMHAVKKKER
ncbi:MAG: prepilin-type N-terminal cleavage/methylation domain-containing protein [Planctomycetes bacterium]|nr:prepilin-type N-terminal cleavage/methylation domain-containing protein [Planctomycetota bacterium]